VQIDVPVTSGRPSNEVPFGGTTKQKLTPDVTCIRLDQATSADADRGFGSSAEGSRPISTRIALAPQHLTVSMLQLIFPNMPAQQLDGLHQ
jgi:hypothetical protein